MSLIRKPAVAGTFYPDQTAVLMQQVDQLLSTACAKAEQRSVRTPKALIAPHAGYRYSGAIAARAYSLLTPVADRIERVILLGPCHRVGIRGIALSGADAFETPLGTVPVDHKAEQTIADLPGVIVFPDTHAQEHALEVHLPFLQRLLGEFTLVPLVVGEASPDQVASVLSALWGGDETLIVVSSDLSHFLDYEKARATDRLTCKAIEALDPTKIESGGACGRFPVGGLLHLANRRGMQVETLELKNSGDTAGPKDRVVGYGAWAFYENEAKRKKIPLNISLKPRVPQTIDFEAATKALLEAHGDHLLKLADAAVSAGLQAKGEINFNLTGQPDDLMAEGACFVTLKTADGQLRGCIGSPTAHRALALDVVENAYKAAFKDPRFKPVSADEYEKLRMSISVLSPQSPMAFESEADLLSQLRPGVDGLVIADGGRRVLFLPFVWKQLPEPKTFLQHLKRKAGLAVDHWSPTFRASRFIAEEIHAKDPQQS